MASDKDLPPAQGDEKSSAVPYDEAVGEIETRGNTDALQRHLGNRQIQMIAIGGSIGTALFVSIGNGLMDGGPGSLLIAFALYSALLGLVNNCMAEMAVYMPVSGTQQTDITVSSQITDIHIQGLSFALLANGLMRHSDS